MEGQVWDNITNRQLRMKPGDRSYMVLNPKTAIMAIKTHTIYYSEDKKEENRLIYMTLSTFDGDLIILENDNPFGKYSGVSLTFNEKLRVKTRYPIAEFCLETQYNAVGVKHYLVGYFIDIFSNLYTINLTTYFDYHKTITSLQPLKPVVLFHNIIPKDLHSLHLEYPLLLHKHLFHITTVSLGGTLRFFDLSEQKSWLNNSQIEPKTFEFSREVLGASSSVPKSPLSNTFVIVLNNRQLPYPFSECSSFEDFQVQAALIEAYYEKWNEITEEIIGCQYDFTTNRVVTSLISNEIEIYEIKKHRAEDKVFSICQKLFRFFPLSSIPSTINHIEDIDANRGLLLVTTCHEYLIFSLVDLVVKKRSGEFKKNSKNPVEKLRWATIIEKEKDTATIMIAKGFNHHNEEQSKVGKPTLHFKQVEFVRKV